VERMVQLAKSTTKYRTTGHMPELLIVHSMLLSSALASVRADHPELKDFDGLVPA
jgi:hypothetical protein